MKPKIFRRDNVWICFAEDRWYAGFSDTPRGAYYDWKRANNESI